VLFRSQPLQGSVSRKLGFKLRRGVESSQRLGRHRFVVERSPPWLVGYRRLQVRYERRVDVLVAFLCLACALIYLKSQNQPKAESVSERGEGMVVAHGPEVASAAVRKGRRMGSTAAACMAWVWSRPSSTRTSQPSASSSARRSSSGAAVCTRTPPQRSG